MKNLFASLSVYILIAAFSVLTSCSGTAQQNNTATSTPETAAIAPPSTGVTDVDVAAFKKLQQGNPDAVVLDVRTPEEFAQGNIEGAVNIDVKNPNFSGQIKGLDKDKTYMVYCRTGRRSTTACQMMQNEGFKNLYNLQGGFVAWQAAN